MNIFRMVLAVLLPPLAVWDKGCGTVALVGILTLLFWIPGANAAMYIVVRDMQRIPPPREERSTDVYGAAQSFKSQPLSAPPSNAPFNTQAATPTDPFAAPQAPAQRTPQPTNPAPWSDTPPATPADNPPPEPQPPARPKPPWES